MKEIFKQYGDMFIACVIVLSLVGIFTALALFNRTGISAVSGGSYEKGRVATVAFDEFKKAKPLQFVVDNSCSVYAGEARKVSDIVTTDTGIRSGYEIFEVMDMNGNVISSSVSTSAESIVFDEPGIYKLFCRANTKRYAGRIACLSIPVNRR